MSQVFVDRGATITTDRHYYPNVIIIVSSIATWIIKQVSHTASRRFRFEHCRWIKNDMVNSLRGVVFHQHEN